MSTYAIGDLQGCYSELEDLLNLINFDASQDNLWLAGDLVNRGPDSLKCLRFAMQSNAVTVLGNHDLYLLALAHGSGSIKKHDTLDAILDAPDKTELLDWLRHQPLIHHDTESGFTMVHAGLPPQWTILQAIFYSHEVETTLKGDNANSFFQHMYGDKPDIWADDLAEWKRLRFITNALTRIRYCHPDGRMDFTNKGPPNSMDTAFIPWYRMANRHSHNDKILFGHWASLSEAVNEDFNQANVYPLDKGCVWGRQLAALRLEDKQYFCVPSRQSA